MKTDAEIYYELERCTHNHSCPFEDLIVIFADIWQDIVDTYAEERKTQSHWAIWKQVPKSLMSVLREARKLDHINKKIKEHQGVITLDPYQKEIVFVVLGHTFHNIDEAAIAAKMKAFL
jgi:hypothetical protein